ncbi:unnamed protein product [Rhodiola kirilowii]
MGDDLLTSLENLRPSTMLYMDSSLLLQDQVEREINRSLTLSAPVDINVPLSAEPSPTPHLWTSASNVTMEVGMHSRVYEAESIVSFPKLGKKCSRRLDSVWGAWFFFSFYFKPVLVEKSEGKANGESNGVAGHDKSDVQINAFLVQHDMENMYMWVFKEKPENALGKMQLRSYMNGHSRLGDRPFPFSVDKGFVRSHRMQRKHYRGLSNPQCVHGIEVVWAPNLMAIGENDCKKWMDLTGRDINFSVPPEATAFVFWRTLPSAADFELDRRPIIKINGSSQTKRPLNGGCLFLSMQQTDDMDRDRLHLQPACNKRKKDLIANGNEDNCPALIGPHSDKKTCVEIHSPELSWIDDFSGTMRSVHGPVTGAKTIYEDEESFLIIISLPFVDRQRVKVTWRNTPSHGIVKISCVSNACRLCIKRNDRTFKLTDPSPEHCPPGDFVREIPLATRIPDDAKLEAYCEETGTLLEIMVPKHLSGPEEHEVQVSLRHSYWSEKNITIK